MIFLNNVAQLISGYAGKVELLNLLLLILVFIVISSFIANKATRITFSILGAIIVILQMISLYFTQTFIGYQFLVHFNTHDIYEMIGVYQIQIIIALSAILILSFCIAFFGKILESILSFIGRFMLNQKPKIKYIIFSSLKISLIIISLYIMTLNNGIIYRGIEFSSQIKIETKNFQESLLEIGINDYISPEDLKASAGKNVIIISLESYEKGYLDDKFAHLTPNLRVLKKKWQFYDLNQNYGVAWTSASLYTSLTGFPAFFGIEGNSIFQNVNQTKISGITQTFNKAGYKMTYITYYANFAGTTDMLHTFGVNEIIDRRVLGKPAADKDLFERAKTEIKSNVLNNKPYVLFISTLDTHAPDGILDERMQGLLPNQNSNLEFMVSAVDYLLDDFIKYLEKEQLLNNTVVYVFPDHLKMGDPSIFNGTGDRGLYLLTNATENDLKLTPNEKLFQIDLPKIILNGAGIEHNQKFLTDYIKGDKDEFIFQNVNKIVALNTSGINKIHSNFNRLSVNYEKYIKDTCRFIAHAGGAIEGNSYTDSFEALENSYKKGFRIFELDIIRTSDGKLIAAHDWVLWAKMTNYLGPVPVSENEFLKHPILGKYTPLNLERINKWFSEHNDAILVTDKINEPKEFANVFVDKNRLMMELFSLEAVKEGLNAGILSSIPSQNVIEGIRFNKVQKLKELGVKHVAVSRLFIAKNLNLLIELKNNGIKTYAFNTKADNGIDEQYVVKYEMDYIYGIYAANWEFEPQRFVPYVN